MYNSNSASPRPGLIAPPTTPPPPLPLHLLPTTTATGGATASTSTTRATTQTQPKVGARKKPAARAQSPKPKRLLSQAGCRELERRMQELEATKPPPGQYDAWKAGQGKLATRSVKDAIRKLRTTHHTLADIDEASVRKSIKAFYPKMSYAKVARVVDGLVASVSIFSSIQSLETARRIVSVINAHRSGKISKMRADLKLIRDRVRSGSATACPDVRTYDLFLDQLFSRVQGLGRLAADEEGELKDLLARLEPAPKVGSAPRLRRRNSAAHAENKEKQERKAHRREAAKSMPDGLAPLPLHLPKAVSRQSQEAAIGKSATAQSTDPLKQSDDSDREVSDPSTTSASSQQVTPRQPQPVTSASSSTVSPSSPRVPASPRRTPQRLLTGKAATGDFAVDHKSKTDGGRGHMRVQSGTVHPSSQGSRDDPMSEATMKKQLLKEMATGTNNDSFVEHYGEAAWDVLVAVVAALDEKSESPKFKWADVVSKAKLNPEQRNAIIATAKLPLPTHANLSESICEVLEIIRKIIIDSQTHKTRH